MSAQVAIYVSAFLGMTVLMGLFAGLVYHRHRKMVNQHRAYERMVQERIQQAQNENLPPFYVDHVRDRACVFEGELPPDNSFLRTLEVVVVRPRREDTMQDLIAAGIAPPGTGNAGTGTRTASRSEDESEATPNSQHRRNPSSILGQRPDLTVSEVSHLGIPVVESGVIRPTLAAIRRPMRTNTSSNNNSHNALAAAALLPPARAPAVPIHGDSDNSEIVGGGQESIHTLPPPPSYDITHTHPTTSLEPDIFTHLVTAPQAGDYFTHHHPDNHSHTHTQQTNTPSVAIEQQSPLTPRPIETPRYSDEFPSHIPHEQHLEGYRRARAISDVSLQQRQGQGEGSPSLSAAAASFVDPTPTTATAAAAGAPTEALSSLTSLPSLPSSSTSSAQ